MKQYTNRADLLHLIGLIFGLFFCGVLNAWRGAGYGGYHNYGDANRYDNHYPGVNHYGNVHPDDWTNPSTTTTSTIYYGSSYYGGYGYGSCPMVSVCDPTQLNCQLVPSCPSFY
jgi:hypothetical protein